MNPAVHSLLGVIRPSDGLDAADPSPAHDLSTFSHSNHEISGENADSRYEKLNSPLYPAPASRGDRIDIFRVVLAVPVPAGATTFQVKEAVYQEAMRILCPHRSGPPAAPPAKRAPLPIADYNHTKNCGDRSPLGHCHQRQPEVQDLPMHSHPNKADLSSPAPPLHIHNNAPHHPLLSTLSAQTSVYDFGAPQIGSQDGPAPVLPSPSRHPWVSAAAHNLPPHVPVTVPVLATLSPAPSGLRSPPTPAYAGPTPSQQAASPHRPEPAAVASMRGPDGGTSILPTLPIAVPPPQGSGSIVGISAISVASSLGDSSWPSLPLPTATSGPAAMRSATMGAVTMDAIGAGTTGSTAVAVSAHTSALSARGRRAVDIHNSPPRRRGLAATNTAAGPHGRGAVGGSLLSDRTPHTSLHQARAARPAGGDHGRHREVRHAAHQGATAAAQRAPRDLSVNMIALDRGGTVGFGTPLSGTRAAGAPPAGGGVGGGAGGPRLGAAGVRVVVTSEGGGAGPVGPAGPADRRFVATSAARPPPAPLVHRSVRGPSPRRHTKALPLPVVAAWARHPPGPCDEPADRSDGATPPSWWRTNRSPDSSCGHLGAERRARSAAPSAAPPFHSAASAGSTAGTSARASRSCRSLSGDSSRVALPGEAPWITMQMAPGAQGCPADAAMRPDWGLAPPRPHTAPPWGASLASPHAAPPRDAHRAMLSQPVVVPDTGTPTRPATLSSLSPSAPAPAVCVGTPEPGAWVPASFIVCPQSVGRVRPRTRVAAMLAKMRARARVAAPRVPPRATHPAATAPAQTTQVTSRRPPPSAPAGAGSPLPLPAPLGRRGVGRYVQTGEKTAVQTGVIIGVPPRSASAPTPTARTHSLPCGAGTEVPGSLLGSVAVKAARRNADGGSASRKTAVKRGRDEEW